VDKVAQPEGLPLVLWRIGRLGYRSVPGREIHSRTQVGSDGAGLQWQAGGLTAGCMSERAKTGLRFRSVDTRKVSCAGAAPDPTVRNNVTPCFLGVPAWAPFFPSGSLAFLVS